MAQGENPMKPQGENRMKQHVSILGVLYIAFAVFGLLVAILVLALLGGAAGIAAIASHQEPEAAVAVPILGILALVVCGLIVFLSIPGLAVGIGLVQFKAWARVLGLVLSAVNLLNFPLGTVLGAYGLWVLLNKDSEALFT